ncbi:GNAT family N-acetyltransferase [Kitasatospora sp. CB01950]|uniref:GNAT family N-acetyltransferase n=1 Tax=Kitasatospora sp. CB01950 TaxID=1703930 RepID=UPI00093A5B16|nr:GNAT family N-acetyltransferase [Kitasatospora sp. CB01950]OKJ01127.1 acetyltransferase [Kitasatospora sp. CB01950]
MGMSVIIAAARPDEAEQILKLQYLAFQSEAELYSDWNLEPLTQSLESLQVELAEHRALVARLGDEVVGSVRGWVDEAGVGQIDRLVVHPRMQRHGLGRRLLTALEAQLTEDGAGAGFELFTGHRSGSLRLYQRLGYRETEVREVSRRLSIVTLAKPGETSLAA